MHFDIYIYINLTKTNRIHLMYSSLNKIAGLDLNFKSLGAKCKMNDCLGRYENKPLNLRCIDISKVITLVLHLRVTTD